MDDDVLSMDNISKKKKDSFQKEIVGKPSIFNRIIAGLFDGVCTIVIFIIISLFAYLLFYKPLGYKQAVDSGNKILEESHLYQKNDSSYVLLSKIYSDDELYDKIDEAITYYYSTDERALTDNKLNEYNDIKNTITIENKSSIYNSEYLNAISYLKSGDEYIYYSGKSYEFFSYSSLISIVIAASIIYLIIPLIKVNKVTLGQRLFKMRLADNHSHNDAKTWQIIIRSTSFILINYLIPILFYLAFGMFTLIPLFISIIMFCVIKGNRGPHDLLSFSIILLNN